MKPWSKLELMTYLDRVAPVLDSSDHFQLLDVASDADSTTIQGAFHTMAAALHPDRHRNTLAPEHYERLVVVYARIAEAYRVLRNSKHRESYLREMARKRDEAKAKAKAKDRDRDRAKDKDEDEGKHKPTKEHQTGPQFALAMLGPKARRLYSRAMAAKRTGYSASAVLNMRMALSQHPQSGFLRDALRTLQSPNRTDPERKDRTEPGRTNGTGPEREDSAGPERTNGTGPECEDSAERANSTEPDSKKR